MKYLISVLIGVMIIFTLFFLINEEGDLVCFGENCISVEVANTPNTRSRGLMFREEMKWDSGMLFAFERSNDYPFWMKNTLIPLDIIWIDENFKVVHIISAEPCQADPCRPYDPGVNAKYVVEVNAGYTLEKDINVGDFVRFGRIN